MKPLVRILAKTFVQRQRVPEEFMPNRRRRRTVRAEPLLGKHYALATFPQPPQRRGGSYNSVRELKPGESLIVRGQKRRGRRLSTRRLTSL
jgi:hypothetical protein